MAIQTKTCLHLGWFRLILALGSLLILYTTLFPFDFYWQPHYSTDVLFSQIDWRLFRPSLRDYVRNMLLFLPLGFSTFGVLNSRQIHQTLSLTVTLLIGLTVTLGVEIVNFFWRSEVHHSPMWQPIVWGLDSALGAAV